MIRLNKYISECGVCSRRRADEYIKSGIVKVNDKVVTELGTQIDEYKDKIFVREKQIKLEQKKIYIMLNKPKGYITTSKDQFNRPCVLDLINESIRVFPIGRLDMDTEGLLLLTNDGEFSNKLMHPKNKVEKTYIVTTNSDINSNKLDKLKCGVNIGDYITKPAKVRLISKNKLEIIISEGKNRQVRRMCEKVAINVIKLERVRIGGLELGELKLGEYRILNKKEINKIIKNNA